jgi:hypothetical protein
LKQEIVNLTKLVEQGSCITIGQENAVDELIRVKDELISERDKLLEEIVHLRSELDSSHNRQLDLEKKFEEANNTIVKVSF